MQGRHESRSNPVAIFAEPKEIKWQNIDQLGEPAPKPKRLRIAVDEDSIKDLMPRRESWDMDESFRLGREDSARTRDVIDDAHTAADKDELELLARSGKIQLEVADGVIRVIPNFVREPRASSLTIAKNRRGEVSILYGGLPVEIDHSTLEASLQGLYDQNLGLGNVVCRAGNPQSAIDHVLLQHAALLQEGSIESLKRAGRLYVANSGPRNNTVNLYDIERDKVVDSTLDVSVKRGSLVAAMSHGPNTASPFPMILSSASIVNIVRAHLDSLLSKQVRRKRKEAS